MDVFRVAARGVDAKRQVAKHDALQHAELCLTLSVLCETRLPEDGTPTGSGSSEQVVAWARPREETQESRIGGGGMGLGGRLAAWGDLTKKPIARWKEKHGAMFAHEDVNRKAQAAARAAGLRPEYKLTFWGCMVAGAVSRRCEG